MTGEELKKLFSKRCVTVHRAKDPKTGKAMLYRRKDLSKMAQDAYDRGKVYFHCKPVDPSDPYGELVECEPEYDYILLRPLTAKEFESLASISTADVEEVMSWLEGLAEPDWKDFHSDSEVSNIAKAALELLRRFSQ